MQCKSGFQYASCIFFLSTYNSLYVGGLEHGIVYPIVKHFSNSVSEADRLR